MEALGFNLHSGWLEGVVRGYKAGLLTQNHYANLTQCETLDGPLCLSVQLHSHAHDVHTCWSDIKLQLSATDYGTFLANEPSPLQTSTISEKATAKLVDEFNFIRSNAEADLSKFLEYMT